MKAIVKKEIRDALRDRWVVGYALTLGVLGLIAAQVGARSSAGLGLQMFGRTTATLTNLCLMLAPLVALATGAGSIARERDRGTLEHLLAQPLERREILLGKYAGLLVALVFATLAGFLPAAVAVAVVAGPGLLLRFALFPLLSLLLIAAMLGLGMLISVRSHGAAQAQGRALMAWFVFVIVYDLLLMGTLVSAGARAVVLVGLLLLNPVDAARVLVVLALDRDLQVLGPAGVLLVGELSAPGAVLALLASMAVWAIVPLAFAIRLFAIGREPAGPPGARSWRRRSAVRADESGPASRHTARFMRWLTSVTGTGTAPLSHGPDLADSTTKEAERS